MAWFYHHLEILTGITLISLFLLKCGVCLLKKHEINLEDVLMVSIGGSMLPVGIAFCHLALNPGYFTLIKHATTAWALAGVCIIYISLKVICQSFHSKKHPPPSR